MLQTQARITAAVSDLRSGADQEAFAAWTHRLEDDHLVALLRAETKNHHMKEKFSSRYDGRHHRAMLILSAEACQRGKGDMMASANASSAL